MNCCGYISRGVDWVWVPMVGFNAFWYKDSRVQSSDFKNVQSIAEKLSYVLGNGHEYQNLLEKTRKNQYSQRSTGVGRFYSSCRKHYSFRIFFTYAFNKAFIIFYLVF